MTLELAWVERPDRPRFGARIAALERGVSYPLGEDRFEIDHGADPFAFFDRLGEARHAALLEDDEVVAVLAAVLRELPGGAGGGTSRAWYLCDLKVRPDRRGRGLTRALVERALPRLLAACGRGYAISMDPSGGAPNRVAELLGRLPDRPLRRAASLALFSLDAAAMRAVAPVLAAERGTPTYLSLAGVKDIVLASTGAAMPLLHVQWGPCAEPGLAAPREGSVHMFCTPAGDPLTAALRARGLEPSASATVLEHGMAGTDWRFVLTSDV